MMPNAADPLQKMCMSSIGARAVSARMLNVRPETALPLTLLACYFTLEGTANALKNTLGKKKTSHS